jgi:competence ComEA-like helix-hairpin-helix protein
MLIVVLFFGIALFLLSRYFQNILPESKAFIAQNSILTDNAQKITDTIQLRSHSFLHSKDTYTPKRKFEKLKGKRQENTVSSQAIREKEFNITEPIDPNYITKSALIDNGIPEYVANNIEKYRQAGGQFYEKSDVKKIYGMDSLLFEKLKPHLKFEQNKSQKKNKKENPPILIDINTANADELMKIKGVGPSFSNRIIKYREMLGYFRAVDQLKEIYGMQEENYEQIKEQVYCSPGNPNLTINTLEAYDMSKHPYIDYKTAKIVVAYRNQHGPFQTLDDLNKVVVINDSIIRRIGPYLDFMQK